MFVILYQSIVFSLNSFDAASGGFTCSNLHLDSRSTYSTIQMQIAARKAAVD